MLLICSREFRQNQKFYFERANNGERIIVQMGKDKSYVITPVNEDDLYFNADKIERLKGRILEAQNGETKKKSTSKGITELLSL